MNAPLLAAQLVVANSLEPDPVLEVLIAYDCPLSARAAQHLVDVVVGGVDHHCMVHKNLWRFDVVELPGLTDLAVEEAIHADMVILASVGGEGLPQGVLKWITGWFQNRGDQSGALVYLYDAEHAHCEPIQRSLKLMESVSSKAGMRFFPQPMDWGIASTTMGAHHSSQDAQGNARPHHSPKPDNVIEWSSLNE